MSICTIIDGRFEKDAEAEERETIVPSLLVERTAKPVTTDYKDGHFNLGIKLKI